MKILLIDDDTDFLTLCKLHLQRWDESAIIITLSDTKELIVEFTKEDFQNCDIIISDYRLDKIDGVLINKYLKSMSVTTPFILISSYDLLEITNKYSHQICDYFVRKQFIMEDFCKEIFYCISQINTQQGIPVNRP
jgi:DNA-binding NtrC family response regulator